MARWHYCNVLKPETAGRRLWQFDAVRDGFKLNREQAIFNGKPIPQSAVAKSWDSLWRKKLNVALLPSSQVFLRVLQLPTADEAEAQQIVELQLERLSPLPVTQMVWSLHLLPKAEGTTRTAIVLMADRAAVEKHLGQLETEGYLADRLELTALDQVLLTEAAEDGVWIYPGESDAPALVAWWTGNVLRNLAWLNLPEAERRANVLQEQIQQMAWAGELEGWLSTPPQFHLLADEPTASEWLPLFEGWTETQVQVEPPLSATDLAARTARRSAAAKSSLLPPEYGKRYHQQFVDRLWMRGLGAVVMLYILGVLVYFGALTFVQYKLDAAEVKLVQTGTQYTNVLQMKARYEVLRDRAALQYAALDCWKALAEELPEGVVVQNMSLSALAAPFSTSTTAPASDSEKIYDLFRRLRRLTPNGRQLFSPAAGEAPTFTQTTDATTSAWRFSVELDRSQE